MYNEKPRRPSHLSTARKPEIGQAHAIIRYSRTFEIRKKKKKKRRARVAELNANIHLEKIFFFFSALTFLLFLS